MPSKHGKSSGEPPEILQHLGRAALAYGISRLTRQESSKSSGKSSSQSTTAKKREHDSSPSSKSKSKSHRTSREKSDDTSSASSHRSSRSHSHKRSSRSRASPGPGSGPDNSELHHHMSQLAAGVLAFGVQRYMHHRHERKRQKAAVATKDPRGGGGGGGGQPRGLFAGGGTGKPPRVDPELSAALASLDGELQGTANELGRLAGRKPSHRDCEVYRGLVDSEERIRRGLDGLRSSVNNVRNLHPGVQGPERTVPVGVATGRKREERARKREAEARIREAEERSREGRGKRGGVAPPPTLRRDGVRWERERPSWETSERFDGFERRARPRDDWGGLRTGGEGRWRRWS